MARSQEEIAKSITDTVAAQDATVEVDYGPLKEVWINPISSEVAVAEERADKLSQFYSTSFIKTATEDEVNTYLTNFTLTEGDGKLASGEVVFATYTRLAPGEVIVIPAGALVSNIDNTKLYVTTEQKMIEGDFISSFYNVTNSWYEVAVAVSATIIGKDYDLPALRIRQLLTPIQGVNVVLNRSAITGGVDSETKERKFERVENAFLGQDKGSIAGLKSRIEDYDPASITAVSIVRSNERDLFQRFTNTLGIDVYVNGVISEKVTEDYNINTTSYYITLKTGPVLSVESVLINGTSVSNFYLEKDDGIYNDSLKAKDRLAFSTPLVAGDVVTVTYNHNQLLQDIQDNIFSVDEDELFAVDALVRSMQVKQFSIYATLNFSSSANPDAVRSDVTDKLLQIINTNEPGAVYRPEVVRQLVLEQVAGLSELNFTRFTLLNESNSTIETVSLPKTAIAELLSTNLLLKG